MKDCTLTPATIAPTGRAGGPPTPSTPKVKGSMSVCIRVGRDELETVKNLMGMSLKAVVAEALAVDLEAVAEGTRLREDLRMTPAGADALAALIADTFDGLQVDLAAVATYDRLLELVVLNEFHEVEKAVAEA